MWPAIKPVAAKAASRWRSRERATNSALNHPHQNIGIPVRSRAANRPATSAAKSFWPALKRPATGTAGGARSTKTSHGRRNHSQSEWSKALSWRSRAPSSRGRRAASATSARSMPTAPARWSERTQKRSPTPTLSAGTYIKTPVTSISRTVAATDQWRTFSVADAGIGVIAPRLPVTRPGAGDRRDPAQPFHAFVPVVERHYEPRRRAALGCERLVGKPGRHHHARPAGDVQVQVVDVSAVGRLEPQRARVGPDAGLR